MANIANMRRPYQITGALVLCLALFVGTEALNLTYYSQLGPGPGFFSFWLALILGVLGIAMIVQATFRTPEPQAEDFFPEKAGYLRMGAVALALLVSALLLERLGFTLTMLGMYLSLLWVLGIRNPVVMLPVALAGSFGAYYVFVEWLSVPLPIGVFAL
jgi:putative tricarboxylic transport membrane protein